MPQRIQLRRTKGWRLPEGAIVVTRSTPWGNPFSVAAGDRDVVETYRQWVGLSLWLRDQITTGSRTFDRLWVLGHLEALRGRDLACFCDPLASCHADVLLDLANPEAS